MLFETVVSNVVQKGVDLCLRSKDIFLIYSKFLQNLFEILLIIPKGFCGGKDDATGTKSILLHFNSVW